MLSTLNALGEELSPWRLQRPWGRSQLTPAGPRSQLRCLAALTVAATGKRTRTFLLRETGDFNNSGPAAGQDAGGLGWGGSAPLWLRGKHRVAAASAELVCPALQTMPHMLAIFKQI